MKSESPEAVLKDMDLQITKRIEGGIGETLQNIRETLMRGMEDVNARMTELDGWRKADDARDQDQGARLGKLETAMEDFMREMRRRMEGMETNMDIMMRRPTVMSPLQARMGSKDPNAQEQGRKSAIDEFFKS